MWATQTDELVGSELYQQDTDGALIPGIGNEDESFESRRDHRWSKTMVLMLILRQEHRRRSQRNLNPVRGKDCPGWEMSDGI